MDRKHFLAAAAALVFSGSVLAQPDRDRPGPQGNPPRGHGGRPEHRSAHSAPARPGPSRPAPGRPAYHRIESRRMPHGDLHRGRPLPAYYRGPRYVVRDYRAYALTPPPRGYHWVHADGAFVLAAIATGVIASIIISQ